MVNATIGQDITVDGMQWRVMEPKDAGNSLKRDKDGVKDYADAKAQGKFIWIRYQVTAKEGGGQITKNHIQVVDGAGNVYQGHESLEPSESLQLIRWLPEEESCPRDEQGFAVMQKSLKAGESYVCQEVFDVPTNATGIKVRVSNLAIVFKKYAFINLGF